MIAGRMPPREGNSLMRMDKAKTLLMLEPILPSLRFHEILTDLTRRWFSECVTHDVFANESKMYRFCDLSSSTKEPT